MGQKILTVEGSFSNLNQVLEGLDISITTVSSGIEALDRLLKEKFDYLIVSDSNIGLDGFSLIASLSAIEKIDKNIITILISSKGQKGKATFIINPNSPDSLKKIFSKKLQNETTAQKFTFSSRGKLKKILFVDDDESIHPIVQKGFSNLYNIESLLCSSGREALSKVSSFSPNLIILDAMMPEMDGIAVMKELEKDPKTKDIPIIFLTGKDRVDELEEMLALGPLGVILKPINLKSFSQEIQEIWNEV